MTSAKEKAWLIAYLGEARFNATAAARIANYKWPNKVGPAKKKKFADEIKKELDEKALTAEEILKLLTDHATVDLQHFIQIDGQDGRIFKLDLNKAKELGMTHLIKKIKYTEYGPEVQLVDSQAALDKLARAQGVYDDEVGTDDKPYVVKVIKGVSPDDV